MRMNPNHWRLFSRSTAAGLGLLLVLTHPLPAAAKIKSDWSKVQAVAPGTRTTVWLYKDQASPGKRKIQGRFRSATSGAITLLLPDGQRRTLQKRAVHKVLVARPLKKRYQGWITLAVAFGVTQSLVNIDNISASEMVGSHAALTVPATVVAFLVAPKMGDIYDVPLKHRDNAARTPPQQRSGTTVPGVAEAGGSPIGSGLADRFLRKPSGPDLLRHQARQALPLHLPDLPVHGLSVEQTGTPTGGASRPILLSEGQPLLK